MSLAIRSSKAWYKDGVKFTCVPGCRRCCGGFPGDVWVTAEEIEAIAQYMGLDVDQFKRDYVRRYRDGRASLKEVSNYDCILLGEHGCTVYPARPKQCRDYPFWPEVVGSKRAWTDEKKHCPGIDDGELHSAQKITEILDSQQSD